MSADWTHDDLTAQVVEAVDWLRFWFRQARFRAQEWEPRECPASWR